jgi:hypothetical protein
VARSTPPVAPLLAFTVVGLIAVIVFDLRPVADAGAPSNIALGLAIVAIWRLIKIGTYNRADFMDITFWVFVLVFFGVAAHAQLVEDRFPLAHAGPYSDVMGETQLRIVAGIVAYLIGRRLARRRPLPRLLAGRQSFSSLRARNLALIAAAVAIPLILSFKVVPFFTSRDAVQVAAYGVEGTVVRAQDVEFRGIGSIKIHLVTLLPLVALVALYATRHRHRLLLGVLLIVNLISNNPIANGRYWTAVVLAAIAASAINMRRRPLPALAAISLCAITLFSLSYLDYFRRTEERQLESAGPAQLVLNADYAMFQQELNGTVYIRDHGYTYGEQIAGSVGVFVPRAVWPSKPMDTGDVIAADAGFNVSASLWTELFVDFGWGGLLAGFISVGYLCASLDRWMGEARGRAPLVVVPMLAAIMMLLLRGSLQPTMGLLIPLVLCIGYCLPKDTATPARDAQAWDRIASLPVRRNEREIAAG